MTRHVVVVGAGISGLAAAYYLRSDGVRVTLVDKAPRVGGLLRVSDVAGVPVDEGAESLLNRRPEAVELARHVGLGDDIVYPAPVGAGLWTRGAIRALPPGTLLGVPGGVAGLDGILDPAEVAAVAAEPSLPPVHLDGDVAIGELVAERLGQAVVDRLVEPLLGGVYAGHAMELSLRATVPPLAAALATTGSLVAAVAGVRGAGSGPAGAEAPARPVFAGIRGGVGRLADSVAATSGAAIRTGVTVRGLARTRDGWRVEAGPVPAPEWIDADAVVVAVPPPAAARLLGPVAPIAAAELARIEQASVGIVTLAFRAADIPRAARQSGFLVPPVEGRTVKAVTVSTEKWPWLKELAGDLLVLRASVGRHRQVAELQRPDDELVAAAVGEVRAAFTSSAAPVDARVTRWGGALPQYAVGHLDRVARIDETIRAVPGLAICGAAFDGVGVAACVARAHAAAASVLDELGVMPLSGV